MKTKSTKKNKTTRAPGMTQISISLPQKIVDDIDKIAAEVNRNRSNFISTSLQQHAEKVTKQSK